jgi:hypothetical protein
VWSWRRLKRLWFYIGVGGGSLLIRSLSEERLIGEGEVVKEIETFGKFLCPDVEHDI